MGAAAYHPRMANPKTLYLIDGHAQIFRAYYAPFGNLTSPTGEPTRAVHVFCQTLLNLIRDKKPDYLAVVLDVGDKSTFRAKLYPDYKAHRDPPPEDFPAQERRIIQVIEAARIPILRLRGFEADDIIATLAKRHGAADFHVYMMSRDKDLDQVLSPHVSLYDPFKDEIVTHDRLIDVKGWTPAQAIDAQTLIGDGVDNVPGVPGIGPKTAAKLLQKYGSIAGVFKHAHELTPKQKENVLAFQPKAELTRTLVTLVTDVPIELDLPAAEVGRFAWPNVKPIFQELGIRKLIDQLPRVTDAVDLPPAASTGSPAPIAESERVTREDPSAPAESAALDDDDAVPSTRWNSLNALVEAGGLLPATREPDPGKYTLVNTVNALDALVAELAAQPAFCVDTETTSINPVDADIVGVALSWQVGRGYYIATQSIYGEVLPIAIVREKLGPILADAAKLKVGHHLKYDMIALREAGMPVAGPMFDTMIAAFVLDPIQTSYKLDTLVFKLLGHNMIPITDLIGKGRDQLRMDQVPLDHITEYAAEDADFTWRLRVLFEPLLETCDVVTLFRDTEMPLVSVLTDMEAAGISIDVEFLKSMSERLHRRTAEIVDEAHRIVGTAFNLDSPKQLGEVLFDKLGMRVVKRTKTTRSTDADTLETLAAETGHPLLKLLLEYRELQKLLGTYVDALPLSRSKRTGRIHTSFHQTGAITGRLSSSDPNLQNIPIRTEAGREIRRAFVPRTSDDTLIVADYSQVELRVLAHYCRDEALIQAFAEDRDIHAFVASQVNGVALDAVTKDMRARAKAVNFGLIYGQGAYGLAMQTGMSQTEARAFIDDYFKRYPRIRGFIDQCIDDARRDGFVRTIQGRKRPILDIDSRNKQAKAQAERLSVNTVIQGSAADLIKLAMIRLADRIHREHLPLRMLLQVHDELVFECPRKAAADLVHIVKHEMSHAIELRVPLRVDAEVGDNWLDAK